MSQCAACGMETPPGARYCPNCGRWLASDGDGQARKTVTVLFCDVVGSTTLGETRDPEIVRTVMTRFYDTMRGIVEAHGGTVEKFIGDAIVALFGAPVAHEDDPLRAVRAASSMREAVGPLSAGLAAENGVTISLRIGIATGEVVVGEALAGGTMATGDTVNTAARLQAAAAEGEILLASATASAVEGAAHMEPVAAIRLRGKASPVAASRLVHLRGSSARPVRLGVPMLGREAELAALLDAVLAAHERRVPSMTTVLGAAGVGKSRLVHEALRALALTVRVLSGRCLAYGDGVTWWPIRDVVHVAAGIKDSDDAGTARLRIDELATRLGTEENVGPLVASALGLDAVAAPQEELFWAMGRLLEALGQERATLVVIDDLHWAESTLLEFLDHVLASALDTRLAIVGTARPELLDAHPGWHDRERASTIRLEALDPQSAAALLASQPGGTALLSSLAARIAQAAEGNPLYIEEMVGMLRERGQLVEEAGGWALQVEPGAIVVPPTIRSLLTARLDALPLAERDTARRASVIGRSFEEAALAELSAAQVRPMLSRHLLELLRREIVWPEQAVLSAGDAYRFRHVLIRDAAYEALTKRDRAALHERFADWLLRVAGDRREEYEQLIGFHLAEAHRYRTELARRDAGTSALGERAASHLLQAGRRAAWSGDLGAAMALLERGHEIASGAELRLRTAHELAALCLWTERHERGRQLSEEMATIAAAEDDRTWMVMASVARAQIDLYSPGAGRPPDAGAAELVARSAVEVLGGSQDHRGLAYAHLLRGSASFQRMNMRVAADAMEGGRMAAEASGDASLAARFRVFLIQGLTLGPIPVDLALAQIAAELPGLEHQLMGRGVALVTRAVLQSFRGDLEEARRSWREGADAIAATEESFFFPFAVAERTRFELLGGQLEPLGGQLETLVVELKRAERQLRMVGDVERAALLALIVRVYVAQGRLQQAAAVASEAWDLQLSGVPPMTELAVRLARAEVHLRQGLVEAALGTLEGALEIIGTSDSLVLKGETMALYAECLRASGDDRAKDAFQDALQNYERKGATALSERARRAWGAGGR